ncbi:hypothetical protein U7230_04515 [Carboxydochorda subterranea]|uniref:Uncharacterized protein n=1 Tax=Carboxydichorda subterranea TaxID=3109565 RepID=A0ABZ1C0K0_9FIRM|nr:hypothetical protein [Limnochorda sp. L945t]WRP18276.1 hypothetical protein U7230_04515 [Limnochorda sp. L945t]
MSRPSPASGTAAPPGKEAALSRILADGVSVVGAGLALGFLLANWTLPALSPLPWLARAGATAGVAWSVASAVLLGLRTARPAPAVLQALASLVLAEMVLMAVVAAPAWSGEAAPSNAAMLYAFQRVALSLLLCGPGSVLGAVVGAAARGWSSA